jgi:nucleoid-associated protein YgaU
MAKKKEKGKGLFGKVVDSVSSRDEKAALEVAQKELEAAKEKAEDAKAAAAKSSAQAQAAANTAVNDARKAAAAAEEKAKALEAELKKKKLQDIMEARKKEDLERASAMAAAAAPKAIAEHTVKAGETLSHLALKYYKKAAKPYWMAIYEANKDVIGDNPNVIRAGMVLKIVELPADLK